MRGVRGVAMSHGSCTHLRGTPLLDSGEVSRAGDDVAFERGRAEDLHAAAGHQLAGVETGRGRHQWVCGDGQGRIDLHSQKRVCVYCSG